MEQDKTQILPKVQADTTPQVRISPPSGAKPKYTKNKKGKKWFIAIIFLIIFGLGCFLGFTLMSHWETTTQSNYNDKVHKVETLNQQVSQLNQEENQLLQRRQQLSQQETSWEAERQQLSADKNIFQELLDEITGKAAQEKAQVDVLDEKIQKAREELKKLDNALVKLKATKDKTLNLQNNAVNDLHRYESQWEGFIYKFKLFINNLTN